MKTMVLTLWRAPSEEEEFLRFLQTTGCIVAYSSGWKESPEAVRSMDLQSFLSETDPPQLMIGLENGFAVVENHLFKDRTLYNITAEKSAVLTYRRGLLLRGKLGQTNLAGYYEVGERPDDVERSFHAWCKTVFSWVRQRAPERDPTGKYRLTSEVKRGLDTGKWSLTF